MKTLRECHLYTFVDTAYLSGRQPVDVARRLCEGGSDIIQLRAKQSSPDQVRQIAECIRPITLEAGVPLVINDHPSVARAVGATCCHLGQDDFFVGGRSHVDELEIAGRGVQIGLSTHTPDQCARAVAAGADYVAIGPVYATETKPSARPVTLDYVRWAAANVRLPWFAIGGINLERLDDVLRAGATRICVVSAILLADDIVTACRTFKKRVLAGIGSIHP